MIKITILVSNEDLGERESEKLLRKFTKMLKRHFNKNLISTGKMYGNEFIVKDPQSLNEVLEKLQKLSTRWSSIRFSVDEIKSYFISDGNVSDDTQYYDFLTGNYKADGDVFS